jgi:UDP-glucose 4-epimerase
LVPLLLEKQYSVVVFDNLSSGKLENLNKIENHPNFKFIHGDIRDCISLDRALRNIDAIVHLAAIIDIPASVIDPKLTHDINVTGTLNVLQGATKNKIKKIIFASSTSVYGEAKKLPIKEDTPLQPLSPYAASKAACEAYLNAFARCYDLNTVTLRFFNIYGPKNEDSTYSGVITKFLSKALNGGALVIDGDGEQNRDFIYISDITRALVLSLETDGLKGEILNVCTGMPTSINKIVSALRFVTGKDLIVVHGPARVGDIRYSYGDATKAAEKLIFKSNVSLEKGLELILKEHNK